MNDQTSLAIFSRGAALLAQANTIQKAKELKSMALTAAEWAKQKGMGQATIQHCLGYALEAEREMGRMLLATERANAARDKKKAESPIGTPVPTLKEIGLSKRESAEAQKIAALPNPVFDSIKTGHKTKREALRDQRRMEGRREHSRNIRQAALRTTPPAGPFDLILADPPWRYEHCEANNREIENQYPTASLQEIFKHAPNACENSILFLWATAPKLDEALQVMKAWGFSYRSCAVWDKAKIGMGYWWRIQHELLLVGVKGKASCTPECERISSVFREARTKHSVKPKCVYEWIERAFPALNKLEMYCRSPRSGWSVFGNEC